MKKTPPNKSWYKKGDIPKSLLKDFKAYRRYMPSLGLITGLRRYVWRLKAK